MSEEPSKGISEKFSKFHEAMMSAYGEDIYNAWLSDLLIENVNDDGAILATTSKYKCERINAQYKPNLQRLFETKVGIKKIFIVPSKGLKKFSAKVDGLKSSSTKFAFNERDILSKGSAGKSEFSAKQADTQNCTEQYKSSLQSSLTFQTFANGPSNSLAFAAASQVFHEQHDKEVIYIYGPSGCGKTHLLNSIGNRWGVERDSDEVVFFSFDCFKDLCSDAAQDGWLGELKRDLLKYKCILIDDIHLLMTAKRSIKELVNLVNNVSSAGVQLVLAGDRAPARLVDCGVDARFTDRLSGGFSVQMSHGDEGLRAEVLQKRVESSQVQCLISDEVVTFLAKYFPHSMRETLGALNELMLQYRHEPITVTEDMARQTLKDRLIEHRNKASLTDLLNVAGDVTGNSVEELKGRAQGQRFVRPRHAFVMVAREGLNESFPRIAAELGRDHTTMISSYRRAQDLHARDQGFRDWVSGMKARLGL